MIKSIQSLVGIENFENLRQLYSQNNQIKNLDISNNLLLETLECFQNPLEVLNMGNTLPEKYGFAGYKGNDLNHPYYYTHLHFEKLPSYYSTEIYSTTLKIISKRITLLYVLYNEHLRVLDITECPSLAVLHTNGVDVETALNSSVQIVRYK